VPSPVKQAADRAFLLFRAVCGTRADRTSFIEALVGESLAGPCGSHPDVHSLPMVRDNAAVEALLFRNTDRWAHLPRQCSRAEQAVQILTQAADLMRQAGTGGPDDLYRQMKGLIDLEDQLQKHLGKVLVLISSQRGWSKLGFAGLGHYAEQRLGISRTTAHDRARLYRVLLRYPVIHQAYQQGAIGSQAALLILRVLGRGAASTALQRQWVDRARQATLKRLRDEVRVAGRTARQPLTDEEWFASLRLAPGDTRQKVEQLGLDAMSDRVPAETIALTLPEDLAADFLGAIDGWADVLQSGRVGSDSVAGRVVRSYSVRGRSVPSWVGFFAMIEDFVNTWDDPQGMPKRKADKVYIRDGWRCTAPGCTSRRNIDDHHLQHLSRGGDRTALHNRTCACRFHHLLGEHGVLASCKGQAPLGITWRLGRKDLGRWYRNELAVPPAG
jgi:hypothetical protein